MKTKAVVKRETFVINSQFKMISECQKDHKYLERLLRKTKQKVWES